MQCYQCGEQVLREAVFCHRCGARLEGEAAGASPIEPDLRDEAAAEPRNERKSHGEQTLWEGGYSSKAMLSRWLLSMVATVGLLVVGIVVGRGGVWLGIAAVIVLLWAYQVLVLVSRRWSVRYRLTNQRFIHVLGIMRRVTDRVELIDVNDITFEQGVLDRLVGVGTIHISSSDPSHPELTLPGIEDVAHVSEIIDEAFRAERRRRGLVLENLGK